MKCILSLFFTTILLTICAVSLCVAQGTTQVSYQAVTITNDITPPRLSEAVNPEYTSDARKNKIEGTVTLMIVVDKKGDVVDAKVVKGLGHGLDESAVVAVKEWKYIPAQKKGEPVTVKMEVALDFFPRN